MGEGYRNLSAREVAALRKRGFGWRKGAQCAGRVAYFGGPPGTPRRWGAPYRRVVTLATGRVQWSRYFNVPDPP